MQLLGLLGASALAQETDVTTDSEKDIRWPVKRGLTESISNGAESWEVSTGGRLVPRCWGLECSAAAHEHFHLLVGSEHLKKGLMKRRVNLVVWWRLGDKELKVK